MRKILNDNKAALIEGFQKGQEDSYSALFEDLYPALCLYALRITGNQAAAEDIAEEAFIKIWQRRQNFNHYLVLKSYLYTIVRNASISSLKKTKNQEKKLGRLINSPQAAEKTKLENMIAAETFRELYTALGTLPSQCRQVISMVFIEGKSNTQVSKALNVTEATIRSQKKRGLMLLRKTLKPLLFLLSLFSFL